MVKEKENIAVPNLEEAGIIVEFDEGQDKRRSWGEDNHQIEEGHVQQVGLKDNK